MKFGSDTYRIGALERMGESGLLLRAEYHAGSIYLGGLAVEGMLRSLIWLRDRSFDERHDLRRIAIRVEQLGLLHPAGRDDDFVACVESVARGWSNSLRFAGSIQAARFLASAGASGMKRSRGLAAVSRRHYVQCSEIVKRCDLLWQRHRTLG